MAQSRKNRFARSRRDGAGFAVGLVAALLLHGGLLLAIILQQPMRVGQAPSRGAVSLVLQPAGQSANSAPVAPRPETPAQPPQVAPAVIANRAPSRQHVVLKARPLTVPAPALSAGQPVIAAPRETPHPMLQSGSDNFVAAAPLGGNANPPPEYPEAAIEHGEQGKILLSIHVLQDGTADFVSVTQGSGYRVLDQAAQDALLHWRFRPAMLAGRPVVQVIPFWINFDLQTQSVKPGQ